MSAKAQSAATQQPNKPAPHDKSAADERRSGMRTIMRVAPYLWPKDRMDIRLGGCGIDCGLRGRAHHVAWV